MNSPSQRFLPNTLAACTEAPRTRWIKLAPVHLHQGSGAAYLKAQACGFQSGYELDGWLFLMAELTRQQDVTVQGNLYASGN